MRKKVFGIFFLVAALFLSCGDDEQVWPAYRQDLAELTTDSEGCGKTLSFDDGRLLTIQNNMSGLVPDTLYRILALYVSTSSTVNVYAAQTVFSPYPTENKGSIGPIDPLDLKAMWSSKRYLNFLVGLKTGGGQQALGFLNHGIEELPDGVHVLRLELLHNQMEDSPYYTQDAYLSCPIYHFANTLVSGRDSVEMSVLTLDGTIRKRFLYETE